LARALIEAGVVVEVLAPGGPSLPAHEAIDGVLVRRYRYAPRSWETLAYTGTMLEQVSASVTGKLALLGMLAGITRAVRDEVRRLEPDIVHAHWWFPSGIGASFALGRSRMITTMHGSDVRLGVRSRVGRPALRHVARRSAALTTVSEWMARMVRDVTGHPAVSVEPMPVDTTLFVPGNAPRSSRFLFVGRLNRQKGIGLLIEALAQAGPIGELDVIGDGEDRSALEARATALDLAARVTFHGARAQADLVPFYQRTAGLVVPSEEEGLGLVAVEAQLCEAPVIAFRSGGLEDVVSDGVTGILVPPGDVAALANALRLVTGHQSQGRALGAAARRANIARFAPDVVAQHYLALYELARRDA
jgi:glycosyltransferase involved in cell wall biosynthesis